MSAADEDHGPDPDQSWARAGSESADPVGRSANPPGTFARSLLAGTCLWLLAACATGDAPDFGGRWRAVNRYAEAPRAIPLQQTYAFHPAPMDGTLRSMLTRWARDANLTLAYLHPSDFTLHGAVAGIHTHDLREAIAGLNDAYAAQGIAVTGDAGRIVVREVTFEATP